MMKLGVFASMVWLVQGADAQDGASMYASKSPSRGQLQVELFQTPQRLLPLVSVSPDPPSSALTLALRAIVGTDAASMGDRFEAVHALGPNLSRDHIAVLTVFLKLPPRASEKNLPGLHGLNNDLLNVLRNQTTPPAGLTDTLLEIYRDAAQDSVIRDYAIQHLFLWYEQGAHDTLDAKEKIRAVLHEATRQNTSTAGTALLGLHRLSAGDAAFSQQEIDRLALSLALSADTELATRITAIQVCAERGISEVLPTMELLARTSRCVPLRLSAIAALGRLGGPEHAGRLRQVAGGQNEAVRPALQSALRRLEQKQ